jgi:hypothetical protein
VMKHEVNPMDTNRAQAFELWMKSPMPMATLTKTFDVTRLRLVSMRRDLLLCWCIGKASSSDGRWTRCTFPLQTPKDNKHYMNSMCYREEAIECVKDHVLQIHKQLYAKYNGDFDRIYTEGYNNKSYTGRVIEPGKIYELSYLECSCPKVKCGIRNHPQQCECSRQSILYILSQLEPSSQFDVRVENTILRGSDRCTFRITRHDGY